MIRLYRPGIPRTSIYVQGQCAPCEKKNYPLESMETNAQMGERILEAFPEDARGRPQVADVYYRDPQPDQCVPTKSPDRAVCRRNKRKSHAALIRRNDSPAVAAAIAARCWLHRCDLFSCAALYVGARQAEGRGSGKRSFPNIPDRSNLHVVNFTDIQLYIYEQLRMRS